ncbi:DUF4811 domain-containing protein [Leuconostoc falkenbergense]|uniref:DUF4811 domain-containing protein n=1 Tax=Leuconostoc falkenbergense TaxID=2766470 RepID=UPI0024A8E2D7|nr:DUF4811 domain-containing protein [Leuconostoc falkenbergense]MDI6552976.1 DUF4811 domain-containing protein [Leuconostoc falkenbergense]
MIILLIALFAILAFVANMMITNRGVRIVTTVIMFAGLILSVAGVAANMNAHYGMKEVTTTTKKQIYTAGTASQGFGLLLYQSVGTNGAENVYVYRATDSAKKTTVAKPSLKTSSRMSNISGNKAYKITKTTRYVYKNATMRLMFGIGGNNHQLKNKHVIYQVPSTWVALTTTQAKSLQSKMTPKTDAEKQALAQQQAQLATLAKTDPDKAAQLQVAAVKKALNIK